MYPYLSLVERKVAEFYHNIDRSSLLVWVKMTYFHRFFRTIHGVLAYFTLFSVFAFLAFLTVRIVISLFQFPFCCLLDCEDGGNHNDGKQKNGDENREENH